MKNFSPARPFDFNTKLASGMNFNALMAMLGRFRPQSDNRAMIGHHYGESVHSGRRDYREWRRRKIAMQKASRKVNRGRR